ncbi:FAD binding domain-containing protein [Halteromyces radiatus]|uniref:FAD binding domain-containing protein n=1 Tax=Halteromyces radiatus TaxID=101107 RepID=UPI00221E9502|nr:FAD binding domain-containing protein [Halteromyces radiatus]KAI8099953.1 FAD binding domain-containing protein [Halteromyces radiatus]
MPPHNDIPLPPPPSKVVDVLIVGAGPVGLLAASLLRQSDFTLRILDVEFVPNHWGRGDNMHGRTMELLERAGLEEELLTSGARVNKLNTYNNTKLIQSTSFVPDHVDSKYQYLLCVGQHITESSLQSHLSRHEVQVERPCTVTHMQENTLGENKATHPLIATVSNLHDQVTEQVECKYILGCDGAHSSIREQLGIVYDGASTEICGGVMDALIRTNFPGKKEFCLLQGDTSKTVSLFPRENDLTRIFVHFSENENALRREQHNRNNIQMEDIQREAKRALMPYRLEFVGTLYWSTYIVGQRQATAMDGMNQRVFLLGDAAHCQSPTLGQGINTGFGDVFNLLWKLCLVERGVLDRKILQTYTMERYPVAKQVLDIDKVAAKSAASHESDIYCEIVQQNRLFTSGFGIYYPPVLSNNGENLNPLISQENGQQKKDGRSMIGARAPNAKVIKATTGKKTRLFDGIDWRTFAVLILAHDISSSETLQQVEKVHQWTQSSARTRLGSDVVCTIVTTTITDGLSNIMDMSNNNNNDLLEHIVIDKLNRAQCHRDYGCEGKESIGPTLVLVRPDGHIGTICHGENMLVHAQSYLDQICV